MTDPQAEIETTEYVPEPDFPQLSPIDAETTDLLIAPTPQGFPIGSFVKHSGSEEFGKCEYYGNGIFRILGNPFHNPLGGWCQEAIQVVGGARHPDAFGLCIDELVACDPPAVDTDKIFSDSILEVFRDFAQRMVHIARPSPQSPATDPASSESDPDYTDGRIIPATTDNADTGIVGDPYANDPDEERMMAIRGRRGRASQMAEERTTDFRGVELIPQRSGHPDRDDDTEGKLARAWNPPSLSDSGFVVEPHALSVAIADHLPAEGARSFPEIPILYPCIRENLRIFDNEKCAGERIVIPNGDWENEYSEYREPCDCCQSQEDFEQKCRKAWDKGPEAVAKVIQARIDWEVAYWERVYREHIMARIDRLRSGFEHSQVAGLRAAGLVYSEMWAPEQATIGVYLGLIGDTARSTDDKLSIGETWDWFCERCVNGTPVDFPEPTPPIFPEDSDDDPCDRVRETTQGEPTVAGVDARSTRSESRTEQNRMLGIGERREHAGDRHSAETGEVAGGPRGLSDRGDSRQAMARQDQGNRTDGGTARIASSPACHETLTGPSAFLEETAPCSPLLSGCSGPSPSPSTAGSSSSCSATGGENAASPWIFPATFPETIEVEAVRYGVTRLPDGWNVCKASGECYDVTLEPPGSIDPVYCTCPTFRYRHSGNDVAGCKHIKTLRELGLIPPLFLETPFMPDSVSIMRGMAELYGRHKGDVERECSTMTNASALMVKWGETSVKDAIYREAKSRAIKEMKAMGKPC